MAIIALRPEQAADIPHIATVTRLAFEHHPHSSQTEEFIVTALRKRGKLSLSLVAEEEGIIIGHVALSPVEMSDGSQGWFGLGPISVHPDRQHKGIGSRLMFEALQAMRAMGGKGCVLAGDPAFYKRFGFSHCPGLVLPGMPEEYFMALTLEGALPQGTVAFDAAFEASE